MQSGTFPLPPSLAIVLQRVCALSLLLFPSVLCSYLLYRHQRYTVSMEFVRRFERQCSSQASVKRLRVHPRYTSFQNKWNLPVYFQLRCVEGLLMLLNGFFDLKL